MTSLPGRGVRHQPRGALDQRGPGGVGSDGPVVVPSDVGGDRAGLVPDPRDHVAGHRVHEGDEAGRDVAGELVREHGGRRGAAEARGELDGPAELHLVVDPADDGPPVDRGVPRRDGRVHAQLEAHAPCVGAGIPVRRARDRADRRVRRVVVVTHGIVVVSGRVVVVPLAIALARDGAVGVVAVDKAICVVVDAVTALLGLRRLGRVVVVPRGGVVVVSGVRAGGVGGTVLVEAVGEPVAVVVEAVGALAGGVALDEGVVDDRGVVVVVSGRRVVVVGDVVDRQFVGALVGLVRVAGAAAQGCGEAQEGQQKEQAVGHRILQGFTAGT